MHFTRLALFSSLVVVASISRLAQAQDAAAKTIPQEQYLRVVEEKGKSVSLEIATHDFVRTDGTGPRIGLVGVAHIADASFYHKVESLLETYDIVLFESVKPAGTGGAGGENDAQRIASTKAAMKFINGLVQAHHKDTGEYPINIAALETFIKKKDARILQFFRTAMLDAWGNHLVYQHIAVQNAGEDEPTTTYSLVSLGADGARGGENENADIEVDKSAKDAGMLSGDDGLQSQLAEALGLEFQLDSLPYDRENWRCSDMAVDEVSRRLEARGLDFAGFGGTLAGTSLPAQMIKLLLGFMKMADNMMEGAISDTVKVVLIEVLGEPKLMEQGLSQLGEGFGEVIINERNQVVIDDLKKMIADEPQVKSIAVLYGAGHMPDLVKQMHEQLGYERTPHETHWVPAITVDMTQSKMSSSDVQRIRTMMRQALRQQLRRR